MPGTPREDNTRTITVTRDIAYLGLGREEKLDLYAPADASSEEPCPGIVIIHGGGWLGGGRANTREQNFGTVLARAGYVCASIDYALSRPAKATWPGNVHDCKRAVQFLRRYAGVYGVDPAHIGAIGGSAGGHLAAMLAVTGQDAVLEPAHPYPGVSSRVQAAVNMYGIADLFTWQATDPDGTPNGTLKYGASEQMLGCTAEGSPDVWRQASPVHHAAPGAAPILILHGDCDTTVGYNQAFEFAHRLGELNLEYQAHLIRDVGHTFDLEKWGQRPLPEPLAPLVTRFLDKHLKGSRLPYLDLNVRSSVVAAG